MKNLHHLQVLEEFWPFPKKDDRKIPYSTKEIEEHGVNASSKLAKELHDAGLEVGEYNTINIDYLQTAGLKLYPPSYDAESDCYRWNVGYKNELGPNYEIVSFKDTDYVILKYDILSGTTKKKKFGRIKDACLYILTMLQNKKTDARKKAREVQESLSSIKTFDELYESGSGDVACCSGKCGKKKNKKKERKMKKMQWSGDMMAEEYSAGLNRLTQNDQMNPAKDVWTKQWNKIKKDKKKKSKKIKDDKGVSHIN